MSPQESLSDFQRLFDLAGRLGLEDVTAHLSDLGNGETAARAAGMRDAGKRMLRELAVRKELPGPLPPDALEKWSRVAPALAGLESMSQRELRHLDDLSREAQEAARAKLETLPVAWQAKCRSTIASALLTAADTAMPDAGRLAARLGRRLASGIRTIGHGFARQLHRDLLQRLIAATDALYSLASAADQVLRALEHAAGSGEAPAAQSLVARLGEQRERWERAAERPTNHDIDDVETALEIGALSVALGVEAVAAALRDLDLPVPATGAASSEVKEAALEGAREALRREWAGRAAGILAAVDAHVVARFAILQRQIDDGLAAAHRRLAALCGSAAGDREELEAVRFEVMDIRRRAGAQEVSP